jgi:hypothetical protein
VVAILRVGLGDLMATSVSVAGAAFGRNSKALVGFKAVSDIVRASRPSQCSKGSTRGSMRTILGDP